MVEFIIDNIETFQIIEAFNVPLTALMSMLVIAASVKYLLKKK